MKLILRMKRIKLFCFILIGLMISSSCSSDDNLNNDNPNLETASIVGLWKPMFNVSVCSTGSEVVSELNDCQQTSRATFYEDGTFNNIEFNTFCEEYYNKNGTWTITEGNLILTTEEQVDIITFFEVTNNRLRTGHYGSDPNNTCDGENPQSHWYSEYVRLE